MRCLYLDKVTGYVTETALSTLCKDLNRLYRYDYCTRSTMSAQQTIANAQYFASRGKFGDCCLFTSGYQFVYNCKINKYTSNAMHISSDTEKKRDIISRGKTDIRSFPLDLSNALTLNIETRCGEHVHSDTPDTDSDELQQ